MAQFGMLRFSTQSNECLLHPWLTVHFEEEKGRELKNTRFHANCWPFCFSHPFCVTTFMLFLASDGSSIKQEKEHVYDKPSLLTMSIRSGQRMDG